jgi:hypothetical protein
LDRYNLAIDARIDLRSGPVRSHGRDLPATPHVNGDVNGHRLRHRRVVVVREPIAATQRGLSRAQQAHRAVR